MFHKLYTLIKLTIIFHAETIRRFNAPSRLAHAPGHAGPARAKDERMAPIGRKQVVRSSDRRGPSTHRLSAQLRNHDGYPA
jgi:hypothetical protein